MKKYPVLLLICFLSLINLTYTSAQSISTNENLNANNQLSNNFIQEVLELVNIERQKESLRPLKISASLNHYAQIRTEEITKTFSHRRPNGSSCFTIIPQPYRLAGENIAAGPPSAKIVVEAWMNSPSHKENIMNPKFREMGIGYLYLPNSEYKHYWTQLFRRKF